MEIKKSLPPVTQKLSDSLTQAKDETVKPKSIYDEVVFNDEVCPPDPPNAVFRTVVNFEAESSKWKIKGPRLPKAVINILHTNDIHMALNKLPYMVSLIHEIASKEPNHLIIDAGDSCYNPPAPPGSEYWKPMAGILNKVGYDAITTGNHEYQYDTKPKFVWSKSEIKKLTDELNAPVLGANVINPSTDENLPGVKPYIFKNVDGIKLGVIGIVTPNVDSPDHPDTGLGLNFIDPDEKLNELIPQMRENGADLIIASCHLGITAASKMAELVHGIDVIIAGHDHQTIHEPVLVKKPNGEETIIVEAGSHSRYVGDLELAVDYQTKKIAALEYQLIPVTKDIAPDEDVMAIVKEYVSKNNLERWLLETDSNYTTRD